MFEIIKICIRALFIGLVFIMAVFLSTGDSLAMGMESGHGMTSHHQHMMLNHVLGMLF